MNLLLFVPLFYYVLVRGEGHNVQTLEFYFVRGIIATLDIIFIYRLYPSFNFVVSPCRKHHMCTKRMDLVLDQKAPC